MAECSLDVFINLSTILYRLKTFSGQPPVKANCMNSIGVPIFSTYSISSSYFSVYFDEKAF